MFLSKHSAINFSPCGSIHVVTNVATFKRVAVQHRRRESAGRRHRAARPPSRRCRGTSALSSVNNGGTDRLSDEAARSFRVLECHVSLPSTGVQVSLSSLRHRSRWSSRPYTQKRSAVGCAGGVALALVAAFLFALAAALQQKGALNLPEISIRHPESLARLAGQTMWLVGTLALLAGYLFQAAALDRGRLAIIQPRLVTTVVFALPLGYFLTRQHVGRREDHGAAVILCGLALFALFGDPSGGRENAPGDEVGDRDSHPRRRLLLLFGGRGALVMKAAV